MNAEFTVAEVLIAAVIITLSFVGRMVASVRSRHGIQEGNQISIARFLAGQRLKPAKLS